MRSTRVASPFRDLIARASHLSPSMTTATPPRTASDRRLSVQVTPLVEGAAAESLDRSSMDAARLLATLPFVRNNDSGNESGRSSNLSRGDFDGDEDEYGDVEMVRNPDLLHLRVSYILLRGRGGTCILRGARALSCASRRFTGTSFFLAANLLLDRDTSDSSQP